MTSGAELLLRARVMSDADVALVFGHGGSSDADEVERAALVAALLSSFTAADGPLVRELTRQEIAAVRDAGGSLRAGGTGPQLAGPGGVPPPMSGRPSGTLTGR